jgi:hypothetical protein
MSEEPKNYEQQAVEAANNAEREYMQSGIVLPVALNLGQAITCALLDIAAAIRETRTK